MASVSPPQVSTDHTVAVLAVQPNTGTQDKATSDLVHRLRAITADQPVLIGGSAAAAVKAGLLNLLSIGAAFGVLVAVLQWAGSTTH